MSLEDEDGDLRLANDELRAVFDLLPANGETIQHRVVRFVEPLDDFNKLCLDGVKNSHVAFNLLLAALRVSLVSAAPYYTLKRAARFKHPRLMRALCVEILHKKLRDGRAEGQGRKAEG